MQKVKRQNLKVRIDLNRLFAQVAKKGQRRIFTQDPLISKGAKLFDAGIFISQRTLRLSQGYRKEQVRQMIAGLIPQTTAMHS